MMTTHSIYRKENNDSQHPSPIPCIEKMLWILDKAMIRHLHIDLSCRSCRCDGVAYLIIIICRDNQPL